MKQDSLIGSILTASRLPKLASFQKSISDTFEPVGAHALVSLLGFGGSVELEQNLSILVRYIESVVEIIDCVAGVEAVAEADQ